MFFGLLVDDAMNTKNHIGHLQLAARKCTFVHQRVQSWRIYWYREDALEVGYAETLRSVDLRDQIGVAELHSNVLALSGSTPKSYASVWNAESQHDSGCNAQIGHWAFRSQVLQNAVDFDRLHEILCIDVREYLHCSNRLLVIQAVGWIDANWPPVTHRGIWDCRWTPRN